MSGVIKLRPLAMAKNKQPNDDRIAKKYCFKATVKILDQKKNNAPYGVFTAYDASANIGAIVKSSCELFNKNILKDVLYCDEAEVVLYNICPVELDDEITFTKFHEEEN